MPSNANEVRLQLRSIDVLPLQTAYRHPEPEAQCYGQREPDVFYWKDDVDEYVKLVQSELADALRKLAEAEAENARLRAELGHTHNALGDSLTRERRAESALMETLVGPIEEV